MNGPEHYREAERLLAKASEAREERGGGQFSSHIMWTAEAQIHATLALAAATSMGTDKIGTKCDWDDWNAAFTGGAS